MLIKAISKEAIDRFPENFTIGELIDRLILLDKIERANSQSEQVEIILKKIWENKSISGPSKLDESSYRRLEEYIDFVSRNSAA